MSDYPYVCAALLETGVGDVPMDTFIAKFLAFEVHVDIVWKTVTAKVVLLAWASNAALATCFKRIQIVPRSLTVLQTKSCLL